MFKHDLEKICSAVSKHSKNVRGFGFSAKNLAETPKKMAEFEPQDPQLFGCMAIMKFRTVDLNCQKYCQFLRGVTSCNLQRSQVIKLSGEN